MPPVWLQIVIALHSLLALCLRIALQIFHGKFETLAYPRSYTHSYSFSPMENLRSLRVREVTLEFSHINNSRMGPRARELSSHYVIDRTNLWVCWQLAQNTQISLIWKLWAGNWLTAVRIVYSLLLLPSGTKINIGHQPLIYRYDTGIY